MRKKKLSTIGKEVIRIETDSLKKLQSNIGKSFEKIVKTILNCKNGKIIVSGVGKSGIIAKKWSATLSSTGTSSFFLDASNASHGDMGQITSNDIIVSIQYSVDHCWFFQRFSQQPTKPTIFLFFKIFLFFEIFDMDM